MKNSVLWIEDGAFQEVAKFTGPLFVSGIYDLDIALNATDAIKFIMKKKYDAIIVDIRIPPGDDESWIKLYCNFGSNKTMARLGRHLLYSLLCPEKARLKYDKIPKWVNAKIFGILTVESKRELETDLRNWKIEIFRQKTSSLSHHALKEMIDQIVLS